MKQVDTTSFYQLAFWFGIFNRFFLPQENVSASVSLFLSIWMFLKIQQRGASSFDFRVTLVNRMF